MHGSMKRWGQIAIASFLVVAVVYAFSFFSRVKFNIYLPNFIQRIVFYEGFHLESFLGAIEIGNSAGGGFTSDWIEFEYASAHPFVHGTLNSPLSYRVRVHRHIHASKTSQYFTLSLPYYLFLGLSGGGIIWAHRARKAVMERGRDGKRDPVSS